MSEKKKETTMDSPWYKQDSEKSRAVIVHSIEVLSLANTLKEITLYNRFLLDEISWVESVVSSLIIPQLESGRTKESVLNEWMEMLQIDN